MIDVQVRTTNGDVLERARGMGVDGFSAADRAAYPLLANVLPWTDTVFNSRQARYLSEELERYEGDPALNPAASSFDWLRAMCVRVAEGPNLMLWFVGD